MMLVFLCGLAWAASPVGQPVPNFTLYTPRGEARTLRQLAPGKPLVMVVWCATCHSCREVEAEIDRLAEEMRGKAVVVALDANAPDTPERIQKTLDRNSLKFPVFLDKKGKVVENFKINTTTTTLIVDAQGRLRYLGRFGDKEEALARQALQQLLAGQEVTPSQTEWQGCKVIR